MRFAKLDDDNFVLQVIMADQAFVDSQPGNWVQTDAKGHVNKNPAVIGLRYNRNNNSFDESPLEPFERIELAKDENGKQIYYKEADGEHKSTVKKLPLNQIVYYLKHKETGALIKSNRKPLLPPPEQEE